MCTSKTRKCAFTCEFKINFQLLKIRLILCFRNNILSFNSNFIIPIHQCCLSCELWLFSFVQVFFSSFRRFAIWPHCHSASDVSTTLQYLLQTFWPALCSNLRLGHTVVSAINISATLPSVSVVDISAKLPICYRRFGHKTESAKAVSDTRLNLLKPFRTHDRICHSRLRPHCRIR